MCRKELFAVGAAIVMVVAIVVFVPAREPQAVQPNTVRPCWT